MIGYKFPEPEIKLSYDFTSDEIKTLAKFLRSKENELPEGLEGLTKALEESLYKCLSLDEIKDFFS